MSSFELFCLRKRNIYAIPIIHYNMEMAAQVRLAFKRIQPDCVAVELAETMELQLLHAASRLPDISVAITFNSNNDPLYYMCEPCDPAFEALRSALEEQVPAHCIDLDVDGYIDTKELVPDPYAVQRLGLKKYYEAYRGIIEKAKVKRTQLDVNRELHMARRLKELSLRYDTVLFVGGMFHVEEVLKHLDREQYPEIPHAVREGVQLCTLTEESCREVMAECAWITLKYEEARASFHDDINEVYFQEESDDSKSFPPDRQKVIYQLYKEAGVNYQSRQGNSFHGYHIRNLMKFARNYALITNRLMPNLFQILTVAKGCVDHNYAYEAWDLATGYPHLRNIDNLSELDLSVEDVWGEGKVIRFHLTDRNKKSNFHQRRRKDKKDFKFSPPGQFSICSYQPEDMVIENFADFLKKKGTQILSEEAARTIPFSTSLEDGLDVRETVRNWHEGRLYVKVKGKPPGGVGSVVIIFDPDVPNKKEKAFQEKFPWCTTWLGEHSQESDMAFYATYMGEDIVGPGISRCRYGGFMMSYPPRRMFDIWSDPDYTDCQSKAEMLLMAAIDYAVEPLVVFVAAVPPRSSLKNYAKRYGKKVVYIPIGQLSPTTIDKLRTFHVLDSHERRTIADDYIF